MNKQQLAAKIWQSANKMRSKIEASEYKDYILGFIFYKFLSDKELRFLRDNDFSEQKIKSLHEDDEKSRNFILENLGYFIARENLFSTWLEMGHDFEVKNVRDALSAFSRLVSLTHKKVFDRVFQTLDTGLGKLGETAGAQTKAVSGLLKLIKDIPMDARQDYDVLGFIYEYLISNFAANAGKKAGEFYTPHEVSLLMSEIVARHLRRKHEIKIYDPTSGSGSLLINIGRSVSKHIPGSGKIKYYAQEWKENTFNLTRMNLVMRGIEPANIEVRCGDTLEDDWPFFDERDRVRTYTLLRADAVVSNPPYSQHWDPKGKDSDSRFKDFGLAPKSKADYAFLLHDLHHLEPDGIMTIILPHGVLFRGDPGAPDGEGKIRRQLIENNHIDAIIGLPPNVFFGTGIATIIMVLKRRRANDDILFIDASRGFKKAGKNNQLRACDIKKAVDTYNARAEIPRYSRKVPRADIRACNYNLNIPRYVDSADEAENWDIFATMFGGIPKTELAGLNAVWTAFPSLKAALFADDGAPHVSLKTSDIAAAIADNADARKFLATFAAAFETFAGFLHTELIGNMTTLAIPGQEDRIGDDVFARLAPFPLIDRYEAYQAVHDEWVTIATDLEIIQTEGFAATKVVDPNMVMKKKGDEDIEVQDGWKGRVIPFDLVQATLLKVPADALKARETRLAGITETLAGIAGDIGEEEKTEYAEAFNDDGDDFSGAGLNKTVKQLKKDNPAAHAFPEDSTEAKLILANDLLAEAKTLKTAIKKESVALDLKTKETIEKLTDDGARELLRLKWIAPIVSAMNALPQDIMAGTAAKIKALADKYAVTYKDVAGKIADAEGSLASLLGDLAGDAADMKGLVELQKLIRGGMTP